MINRAGFIAVAALVWAVAVPVRAQVSLTFDPGSARDLEVHAAADGVLEFRTLGHDPRIRTVALPENADLARNHVLSFEYFSLTGLNHFQAFLVPPETEGASIRETEGLNRSEGWSTFSVDLAPVISRAKRPVRSLRLDFGDQPGRTIRVRNLHLRPKNEQEREFAARLAAQAEQERVHELALRKYLDADFPAQVTNVRADAEAITIEGRIPTGKTAQLIEIPIFTEIRDAASLPAVANIAPSADGRFSLNLPRVFSEGASQRDRLFSRWAIVGEENGTRALLSHARYPDHVTALRNPPEVKPRGRKGVGALWHGRPLSDLDDLGITAVTVNVLLGRYIRTEPGPGRTPFTHAGRTWYANDRAVEHLDRVLAEAARRNILVSGIILVERARDASDPAFGKLIAHPDAHPSGHYVMPNVLSADGHAAYAAALEFLARRYTDPSAPHGRIHHWIIHNEVDAGWEWTNAGEKTALRYLDLYHKSLRTAHLIVRQYDPNARVFVSLTHHWARTVSPRFYPSRDLLELLLQFCRAEGDFDWAIAYHPYPQSLANPRTWEDEQAQYHFDTPKITFKNLEVLDAWVRQPRTQFLGRHRRLVHLTEQAPNSPDYSERSLQEQAAAMAYTWKKLKRLDTIEVFHLHNWVDNRAEGGLRIGLRRFPDDPEAPHAPKPIWHVYRALDTPDEDEACAFALKIIGIRDWSEIIHRGEIR